MPPDSSIRGPWFEPGLGLLWSFIVSLHQVSLGSHTGCIPTQYSRDKLWIYCNPDRDKAITEDVAMNALMWIKGISSQGHGLLRVWKNIMLCKHLQYNFFKKTYKYSFQMTSFSAKKMNNIFFFVSGLEKIHKAVVQWWAGKQKNIKTDRFLILSISHCT